MTQTATPELTQEPFLLPASFAQQRMWFLDQLEGGAIYNVPVTSRLRGPLDAEALERALGIVVARHESLRTGFVLHDGVPHQVISPPGPVRLQRTDLSAHADAPERALELAGANAREGFDLADAQLYRAALIRIGEHDHIFALTLHHIITDGWSMGVLSRELSEIYGALITGSEPELPELEIQYADYAAWQQEWMESGGLQSQLEYWTSKLAGAPAQLELATDKPRPYQQSFRGATLSATLPDGLARALRSLSETDGATMFMTMLAGFYSLLSRYSTQSDIVVATPVANRSRTELEQIIGLLVNTLALRVTLDDDPCFTQLLARVRETSLEAFSNQDLPFERLVQELNPERSQSHAPVAQVLFVLQTAVDRPSRLAGLEQERVLTDRGTAKFDLGLFVVDSPQGLQVSIEYCSDLFEASTVQRMLAHYRVLLESAVADPQRPVAELAILSAAERARLAGLAESAPAPASLPCAHERFAAQAASTPDAVALSAGAQRLTYAELELRTATLAARLRELGAGPDVVVAIAAERSVEMVVAVLAVLRAGAAYAAIDPGYPAERVSFMLSDCGACILLTQERLLAQLPDRPLHTICLDGDPEAWPVGERAADAARPTLEHLAYVIYTSGSTGRPKGVAMPHRPLANLLAWQLADLRAPVAARTLQFASLSFDVAFQELFSTWSSGGTLVLIDEATRRDAHALLGLIAEEGIERLFLPFVALQSLCEAAEHVGAQLPQLREVITAGEQLKVTDVVRRFFERHPDCRLYNHYGPSETHVVTSYTLDGPAREWPALPAIGSPIAGTRVYLLDRHRQPVALGLPGEIYVGGISVARGYLAREELTAERFVHDPFVSEPGARMYKTGDLARHLPDGSIAYLGRGDDQVKIRGFRVELGEVEAMLAQHPDVAGAAAVVRADTSAEPRLVGYVVPSPGAAVDERDLLAHARRLVPDYMVPQSLVVLPALPLTPSGKLDRRALPAPSPRSPSAQAAAGTPNTELERALAAIWQRLLGHETIGVEEDFFELGGHSLLAVQLVHTIEDELRRTCTLPMLFRTGTVRALAAELQAGGGDATEPSVLRLAHGTGPSIFCICGIHAYQELAEELSPDYSLFGVFLPVEQELFQHRGVRALRRLSVPAMAARYVEAIREHQPAGPYLLLGFCFGGVLAYEIAQQLRGAGEQVELLTMLDSTLASVMRRRRPPLKTRLETRLKRRLIQACERLPRSTQRRLFGDQWATETQRLERLRSRIYGTAMRRYRVRDYPGRAVLVQPESSARTYASDEVDASWGWSRHIEALTVCQAPGAHISHLRRPNVRILARVLRQELERTATCAPTAG